MNKFKWPVFALGELVTTKSGGTPCRENPDYWNGPVPWFSGKDLKSHYLHDSIEHVSEMAIGKGTRVCAPDTILVLVRGMTLMKEVPVGLLRCRGAFNQDVKALVAKDGSIDARFIAYFLRAENARVRNLVTTAGHGTGRLPLEGLEEYPVPKPPIAEQRKIADILTTWDEALEKFDALIEAQERRKKALMQQLLTGRLRLKGFDHSKGKTARDRFGVFPADWRRVRLGEVTREVGTRNAKGTKLPVLSCTKHRGLVLSEEYFGKRVYAEDTSGYRVVKRGEFAYATNHIEEGSIGYQNLCEAGLVSPIYTVFRTTEDVDDGYLFRVLKSPLLIHLYQVNTSASVDRRGSLRYEEFSRIQIWLPGTEEQAAITQVFDTADQQLNLLRAERIAIDQQKRGLMQRLLTGKLRVNNT